MYINVSSVSVEQVRGRRKMSLILRVRVQLINGHLALAADEETFAHDTSWMPTWDFTVFQNSSTLVQGSHSKCVLIFRKV